MQIKQLHSHFAGTEKPATKKATVHPTLKDLHWAAGLLEGEGCFTFGEHGAKTERIDCPMTDKEPPERLLALFGGSIRMYQPKVKNNKVQYRWRVYGSRARGVMLTLYSLLSPRRKEAIRRCLSS